MRFENPHYAVPCTRGAVGALSMSLENRELAVTDKSVSHQIYFKKCLSSVQKLLKAKSESYVKPRECAWDHAIYMQ